jgi:hypothetical protein
MSTNRGRVLLRVYHRLPARKPLGPRLGAEWRVFRTQKCDDRAGPEACAVVAIFMVPADLPACLESLGSLLLYRLHFAPVATLEVHVPAKKPLVRLVAALHRD